MQCEEDKITTYDDIFEDLNKSENGSDWNVSTNHPFDIKENGFPQPLPTSDIGSIFNKYGSGWAGEEPTQNDQIHESRDNQKEATDLLPSIIK